MHTTVIGALPKLPVRYEEPDNLRRAINAFEAGKVSPRDREQVTAATQARAVRWQEDAGLDLLGDGQIRWNDLVSPLCLDVAGLEPGGLLRFFQNNTYYRHPVVTGRLWLEGRTLPGWFAAARALTLRPMKAALPGPYTVARLSEDRQYGRLEPLLADLAEVLGMVARLYGEAGAAVVELEDPSLAREPDAGRRRLALDAVRRVAELAGGPLRLCLYFGDPAPWMDELADLPVEGISFDVVEAPAVEARLCREGFPGRVGLGLIDARSLRLESVEELLRRLEAVALRVPEERLLIHPNTSLEYLPSDGAVRKLELLHDVAQAWHKGGVRA